MTAYLVTTALCVGCFLCGWKCSSAWRASRPSRPRQRNAHSARRARRGREFKQTNFMKQTKWSDRSPEEREQIEINRSRASYQNPFHGKNAAQRQRLHNGFNAMA